MEDKINSSKMELKQMNCEGKGWFIIGAGLKAG